MTDQTGQGGGTSGNTKWNTPKGMLNSRIDDVDDYVFIGKKRDGSPIVLSSGDQQFAHKLLQNAGQFTGQDQGSRQPA